MKMYKSAGNFAKVGEDIVDKDILTIEKDGEEIAGKYGAQIVFGIGTKNGSKNLSFNKTSTNNLINGFGDDSEKWIGKKIVAFVSKERVQGELKNVAYFAPQGWIMDDNGGFHAPKKDEIPAFGGDGEEIVF